MKNYSLLLIIIFSLFWSSQSEANNFKAHRIAHAGGGINGKTYTNSYEALNLNIKKGFVYFEIDFSFTKYDQLVCLHDWEGNFEQIFKFKVNEKLTLDKFKYIARNNSEYENCTLDGLALWMNQNPSAIIITDVKENNIDALKIISRILPNASKRVIPQIYYPENFKIVQDMGYESIIWTLYRFPGSNEDVLIWIDKLFSGSFAITMPQSRATTELPKILAKKEIPSYVYTINSKDNMLMFINGWGITEIYTDFIIP